MSLFLGRIHYWLYNKISWYEALEDEVINYAASLGLDTAVMDKEINEKYGKRCVKGEPFENLIDTSNIHGWLQERIVAAESRMGAWTAAILEKDDNAMDSLKELYRNQGIKAAKEVGSLETPEEIFNKINDYLLSGMPCDRVNEVVENSENHIKWRITVCIHKANWEGAGCKGEIFHELRKAWIEGFVNEVNGNFEYINEGIENTIKRK